MTFSGMKKWFSYLHLFYNPLTRPGIELGPPVGRVPIRSGRGGLLPDRPPAVRLHSTDQTEETPPLRFTLRGPRARNTPEWDISADKGQGDKSRKRERERGWWRSLLFEDTRHGSREGNYALLQLPNHCQGKPNYYGRAPKVFAYGPFAASPCFLFVHLQALQPLPSKNASLVWCTLGLLMGMPNWCFYISILSKSYFTSIPFPI